MPLTVRPWTVCFQHSETAPHPKLCNDDAQYGDDILYWPSVSVRVQRAVSPATSCCWTVRACPAQRAPTASTAWSSCAFPVLLPTPHPPTLLSPPTTALSVSVLARCLGGVGGGGDLLAVRPDQLCKCTWPCWSLCKLWLRGDGVGEGDGRGTCWL